MTSAIIITFCALLLLAYVFDLTASKTKIPSVILLLLVGWGTRQITGLLEVNLPDFSPVLPVLGTVGLILIVLEGSLELELNKTKLGLIGKSFTIALVSLLAASFAIAWLLCNFGGCTFRMALVNAIPLCVISSAIAIPSARNLAKAYKEFVIYESSFSDILGVLLFNFIALNETFSVGSFGSFGLELVVMILVSFVATIALALLLNKIEHHVKFVPIVLLVILIYSIAKMYHLPALLYILIFGLFIGNLEELKDYKWIKLLRPEELEKEVNKFKEITVEATFVVRALFFLVFGYLIETAEILNTQTLAAAVGVVVIIFVFRIMQLKIARLPLNPLLFVAPRGLITILLFLSIEPAMQMPLVNKSLVIQVIIFTALIMMVGVMASKKEQPEVAQPEPLT